MERTTALPYHLTNYLTGLFALDSSIASALTVCIYKLNKMMVSERSSIFLFEPKKQQLISFTSLDLERYEIRFPISRGVAGWVFDNLEPAIVNKAYEDSRFYRGVDDMTGFQTRNLICIPLFNYNGHCFGTLQSLNKKTRNFTADDLEFLDLVSSKVASAINNRP